jgi:hypothetical protein
MAMAIKPATEDDLMSLRYEIVAGIVFVQWSERSRYVT